MLQLRNNVFLAAYAPASAVEILMEGLGRPLRVEERPGERSWILLDTVSHEVVWLSDHIVHGGSPMPSRNGGAAPCGRYHVVPIQLLVALCSLLLMALPAAAQSTAGRILGTITDQSGAAVSGAS